MDVPSPDATVESDVGQIGRTAQTIRDTVPVEPDWLVPGMLAPGQVTELNGREKVGKGYLLHYLIGALERGEPTFLGPSKQTTSVIFTEEPTQALKEKFDLFDVKDSLVVYHWELGQKSWLEVVDWLVERALEHGAGVIFIDNFSAATKTQDEAGVELARKMEPLAAKAKEHDLAVLYDRHQKKTQGTGRVEDASRGSTGLAGAVDVIVAMMKTDSTTRERKLSSRGRLWSHNWEQQIELTEDHKDFVGLAGDWKQRLLFERDEWTAKEFAVLMARSEDTARTYLEDHPNVSAHKGAGKNGATLYRVSAPPTID